MAKTAPELHPRNVHIGQYPIDELLKVYPALQPFVVIKPDGEKTIHFSDPKGVKALNAALLAYYYHVSFWDIPQGYLCPPIPGRADYVHYIADLVSEVGQRVKTSLDDSHILKGKQVRGVDIGTGANVIYPILANRIYGWRMLGTDIDQGAVNSANAIVKANPSLKSAIDIRQQTTPQNIFDGVIGKDEVFDFCMCNPPFHRSAEAAHAGSQRKIQNLSRHSQKRGIQAKNKPEKSTKTASTALNFAGQSHELWCDGGELGFIQRMLKESLNYGQQIRWFTCLVSSKDTIQPLLKSMAFHKVAEHRVIDMAQGQKVSRFIAWRV